MKTMKKIVAILAVALMLCSILPLSALAADGDETITVTGNTGVLDGTASISWDGTNYQVVNYKDNSSTAIRTSDSDHFRVYVGNEFYVQGKDGALMSQVVINCVSSYLINNTANTVDEGWTVTANGTTITYTATSGAASELHISIGKQSRVKSVVITPAVAGGANCDHDSLVCGESCTECGEYTKEHVFANNCTATCANCSAANPNYADHVYDGTYDAACNVCGYEREISFPAADSVLTIVEADAMGLAMSHNTTTPGKYYVTGVVESIANTTYGNLYIQDENGNKLYVYGTYSADGSTRFDAMSVKPEVGMTITVYGVIGNYNSASQMKNAWITDMVSDCEHVYEFECSTACSLCGKGVRDVVCVNDNPACIDGLCIYCGGDVAAVDHAFDSDYDADCNYGCGYIREVEEAPSSATITFDDASKRTSSSTTEQVWQENGIVVKYVKGSYNNNLAEYANPIRFYAGTIVTIHFSGITSIEIVANNASYATVLGNSIAGSVVDGTTVTYILPAVADSFEFTLTAQARVNSITVYGSSSGSEDCTHEWNAATCTAPATCALCGATDGAALGHSYEGTVMQAPSCTNIGVMTYSCTACGDTYNEDIAAAGHNFVDGNCAVCGAELPSEATITFDADKTQRNEYTTETQKWSNDGLELINNKAGSTTNIGDYAGRFYKDSEIIISFPGMTSLVIDATGMETKYLWDDTLTNAGLSFTVENKIYTITFAEPTDSITLTAANQVRAAAITASAVKAGCEHQYFDACSAICEICGEEREVSHNVVHVEAKAATCAANGNIEYWYCDVCGMAWLNAECNMNTNLRAVILPATGEHAYDDEYDANCNVCGDIREVPEKPADVVYGDANGDGIVDILDEALLAQFNAGWDVTLDEAAADTNGDGIVDILDEALLAQFNAGWDVVLGPEESVEPDEQGPLFNDGELGQWPEN